MHLKDSYVGVETKAERICREGSRCWSKKCPTCAVLKCKIIRGNVVRFTSSENCYHFVFTYKQRDEALASRLQKLKADFRRMRQRTIWSRHVFGGVFSIHLVSEKNPDRWNPHVHVLVSSLPVTKLPWEEHWQEITCDSHIVHVEKVKFVADKPFLLPNYIIRPPAALFQHDKAMMDEYIATTHKRPLVGTIGDWRGVPLLGRPPENPSD